MMVRGRRGSLKEIFLVLLLLHLLGRFWIHFFHFNFFELRKCGEMADKGNQFPTVEVIVSRRTECGHAAEHDAVLDGVVEFAVGHILGFLAAHIWGTRIHGLSIHGIAGAVVRMAGGAVIGPVVHAFAQYVGSDGHGVQHRFVARWESGFSHRRGQGSFDCFRRRTRGEAAMDQPCRVARADSENNKETNTEDKNEASHERTPALNGPGPPRAARSHIRSQPHRWPQKSAETNSNVSLRTYCL